MCSFKDSIWYNLLLGNNLLSKYIHPMHIKRLKLTNFRNLQQVELEFSSKNNLIYGPNGSGKTNLLEALFYVGAGRSFRTHLDEHLVNRNSDFFRIESGGYITPHDIQVEIAVKPGSQKAIKVNSAHIKRLSRLFEYFRLVEFSPYDLSIINGAPSVRRRFLSLTISQSEPSHIAVLSDYHKTLLQRNALLKTFQGTDRITSNQETSLSVWDEKLAETAVVIHKSRTTFTEKIRQRAADFYAKISGNGEAFNMEYSPSPGLDDYTESALCEKFASRRQRELVLRQTLYGPHRDELKFTVDALEAKTGASQGQIKTAVLSLKLAQYSYLKEHLERTPIILLDEIYSDLDSNRLEFITKLLPELGQVFITTSKLTEIKDLTIFENKCLIENGIPHLLK
jgi:DNA replication and repair protein RecF